MHILIAEDDRFMGQVHTAQLKRAKFDVTLAKNGEDALRLMKEKKPDLNLLIQKISIYTHKE